MKHNNPCVSLCLFDGKTGWCQGCGCTLTEIRQWKKMTPFHRTALERQLAGRVRLIAQTGEPAAPRKTGKKR